MTVRSPIEPEAVTVVTASTAEPVTLKEIKAHLRVGSTHENDLLNDYAAAARDQVERWTGRALMPQTLRLTLQDFPTDDIVLPRSPVTSASTNVTVKYFADGSTSLTTVSSSDYIIDHEHEPGRVVLKRDAAWPTETLKSRNPIQVDFKAGYADAASVPAGLKTAVRSLTANYFENREPVIIGTIGFKIPFTLEALLESFTVRRSV